jgi:hypothetical protein
MPNKKPTIIVIYRSAISGRIVTRAYAENHPKTTIRERITR